MYNLIERAGELIYETNYNSGSKFLGLKKSKIKIVVARSFHDNKSWVYFKTTNIDEVFKLISKMK